MRSQNRLMTIDLNCDMGESFGAYSIGSDDALLDVVTSANIACGFHAGDPSVMRRTAERAVEKGVAIGAHPGLPDLAGFGRREMTISPNEVFDSVAYQIGALEAIVRSVGGRVCHVKPHGALYNMAAREVDSAQSLADAIARAVYAVNPSYILVGLANSSLTLAGAEVGLRVAHEGFCDRTYQQGGSLTLRSQPKAIVETSADAARQAVSIATRGVAFTSDGKEIPVSAQTLCIHGDTPNALAFARAVRAALEGARVRVQAFDAESEFVEYVNRS